MVIPKEDLISVLADGRIHSGSDLGAKWGVSRASISKAVGKLDLHGLEIFRVRGKGYRLKERLYLLSKPAIQQLVESELQNKIASLEIFQSISSTNTYLLEKSMPYVDSADRKFHVCLSEMQQSGRGSRGRDWVSPFGHNIYLSLSWKFAAASNSLDGLSLDAGLAVVKTTRFFGLKGVGLKWPNDLQIDSKKIGGILVEVRGEAPGIYQVVIGVGINLNISVAGTMSKVDQPWSCLAEHGFKMEWRNNFASRLILDLIRNMEEFQGKGFSGFQRQWSEFDVMLGKDIEIISQSGTICGRCAGIDKDGALIVKTIDGLQVVRSGQVSLRIRPDR